MSRGMLLLAGLFTAAPLAAQSPEPAPVPRSKPSGKATLEIRLGFGSPTAVLPSEAKPAAAANNVPLLPPVREGAPAPVCDEPPTDAEVLKALPQVPQGIPNRYEVSRNDIVIVKNRLVDKIDAPRVFPLVGIAQLHHCRWECTVSYTETIHSDLPFPVKSCKKQSNVVYIDKDFLHAVDSPPATAAVTQATCPAAPTPCAMQQVAIASTPAQTRFSGTWCREVQGQVVAFHFADGELTLTVKSNEGGMSGVATLTAEYAVTKDGTVHGVFTGADVNVAAGGEEQLEVTQIIQTMVDQPFAFRCRSTSGGLMVSNVRLADPSGEMKETMAMLCGKYSFSAKGVIPNPKATAATNSVARRDVLYSSDAVFAFPPPPVFAGPPMPCMPYGGPIPVGPAPYATPVVQACPSPYLGGPPMPNCPSPGYCPPPEVHAMMMQTIGQMMSAPPMPATCAGPVMPAQSTWTAAVAAPVRPAGAMPVGTWTRDLGPMQYKLEIKENHLFITVTTTQEENGKIVRVDHVLTADCYTTRNPGEVVGLVTGFDITASGSALKLDDVMDLLNALPGLQKEMTGKPIALTFRQYDDSLLVGDVRMPFQNVGEEFGLAFAATAGKYKVSSTALTPRSISVTPASHTTTLPRCIPPCAAECVPAEQIGVDFNFNPPVQIRTSSVVGTSAVRPANLPPMPPPTPLPVENVPSGKSNPFRNGGM